jgi:nicotinamidase-related amidase
MKKLLVVVDFQNDFIDGALGTPEAVAIVPNVSNKIKNWDGDIVFTADTHGQNYLKTNEGKHLPVAHCVKDTNGWELNSTVAEIVKENISSTYFEKSTFLKSTFGSLDLMEYLKDNNFDYIEFIGLCTDICVVSNAIMAKAYLPESKIVVDASCCAGVTPDTHKAALTTMKMCQIEIVGE